LTRAGGSAGTVAVVEALRLEYDAARAYTRRLYDDLAEEQIVWRPSEHGSGIGWHLGHQAAVNHFLVRNLVAAEPSLNPDFDALFDSATDESYRGILPPLDEIVQYREAVAASTRSRVDAILRGEVGAPEQLGVVATVLLTSLVNHEYQHSCWIGEVRDILGAPTDDTPPSPNTVQIDGYWVLQLPAPSERSG
jgi:hypothetical protein